ncbi:hypothetical protein LOTGIDRAFT_173836 [Lottia gigantea]|uniref:Uncharacterized protein n=1 Tax=Lottia gigantea TaxID=225164 RepID=V4CBB7_LOTGI|nr:hypothetical protein LOTGIDRAFT_173836 [Lottia gigantea]ESO99144.1 hypothetical protein LOTGIDRAFT_173836 [Lottia gigantea]
MALTLLLQLNFYNYTFCKPPVLLIKVSAQEQGLTCSVDKRDLSLYVEENTKERQIKQLVAAILSCDKREGVKEKGAIETLYNIFLSRGYIHPIPNGECFLKINNALFMEALLMTKLLKVFTTRISRFSLLLFVKVEIVIWLMSFLYNMAESLEMTSRYFNFQTRIILDTHGFEV